MDWKSFLHRFSLRCCKVVRYFIMKRQKELKGVPEYSKRLKIATEFRVEPRTKFEGFFPHFRQPKQIGCFSQDQNHIFQHDRSSLKYLTLPEHGQLVSFPIWTGFDKFIAKDDSINEYINHLLKWIILNQNCFYVPTTNSGQMKEPSSIHQHHKDTFKKFCLNTDFVSWRGLLTKLSCTPYERQEGWKIACTLYNGTIYMCEFDTEERKIQKENKTAKQELIYYGGFKFEQYLCADAPGEVPDTTAPVNNKEAFCSIVRSRLRNHSLVYGGEVDCCEDVDGKNFVELKTTREMYCTKHEYNFKRYKLLKWWAQSFLIGISKVIAGFRSDDGIVERLETFNTMDIPKICKSIRHCWDPNVCFNFLDSILDHFKQIVTEDNPGIVYLFEWNPNQDTVTCTKQPERSEYMFLPTWYFETQEPKMSTSNSENKSSVRGYELPQPVILKEKTMTTSSSSV